MRTAQGGAAGKMTDRFYSWPPSPPCERRRNNPPQRGQAGPVFRRCGRVKYVSSTSVVGQTRKSVTATEMSVPGGRADFDFGLLDFRI